MEAAYDHEGPVYLRFTVWRFRLSMINQVTALKLAKYHAEGGRDVTIVATDSAFQPL